MKAKPTIIHVSPHPDDEALGACGALLMLQGFGYHIINFACSLGRERDADRRRRELEEACRRLSFELILPEPPGRISSTDDLQAAEDYIAFKLAELLRTRGAAIVVSPSPHDMHHGHEVAARAARKALESLDGKARWWLWGLWADLPLPNIFVPLGAADIGRVLHALEAHAGELERNDYRRLLSGRAQMNSCLGAERVFGFGAPQVECDYAEVLTELVWAQGDWIWGSPRVLGELGVLAPAPLGPSMRFWLDAESVPARFRSLRTEFGR